MISDISVIECYSAFAKKVRTGEIADEDFRATLRVLAADLQSGTLQLTVFDDQDKKKTAALIEEYGLSHGLRTLDAMQLAMINKLGVDAVALVYCADRQFAQIVEQEGFTVRNPEKLSIEDNASMDSLHG